MNRHRWLHIGFFMGIVGVWTGVVLLPSLVHAQLAPVAGAHYDSMAGTGFQGGASASGGYSTSIGLNLPAAHGSLPIPVQVVYTGGKSVGAAGLGWEVPVSFILRSTSTEHRRPYPQPFSLTNPPPLIAPERWTMNLLGESVDLVRNTANTAWVGRRGHMQIEVRSAGDGLMVAYDGNGRTYNFSARGVAAGSRLMNGNLFLLTSITGPDGNQALLNYAISAPSLPGGGTGLAINLSTVAYNKHPSVASCFKHKVFLTYDTGAASPLALSVMDGNTVWARVQKLASISIKSKETCGSSEKTLATYALSYSPDIDTRQPRLQSVTMTGQQGTPEQHVTLPVATYTYGSVIDPASNQITYQQVQNAGPPTGPEHYGVGISFTKKIVGDPSSGPGTSSDLETQQILMDLNGDGRLDFSNRDRQIFFNNATATGPIQFRPSTTVIPAFPKTRTLSLDPAAKRYQGNRQNETYVQHLDMNGDGRIDVVDAIADPANWLVYLNAPDPTDSSKSVFITPPRKIPTARVRAALQAIGLSFNQVPLARKVTVPERPYVICWFNRLIQGRLIWMVSTRDDFARCEGAPPENLRKRTITEFELKDINGDGYPDFLYNASRVFVDTVDSPPQPDFPPPPESPSVFVPTTLTSEISGSREVKALINTAGVRLAETEEMFSSPITLETGGSTGCGVGRWEVLAPVSQDRVGRVMGETCGFQDINGDGLVDRVTTSSGVTTAKLGTGDVTHPFVENVTISLPGPLARSFTDRGPTPGSTTPRGCIDLLTYDSITQAQLRDINGDGLPDYLREVRDGEFDVAMGTGLGFAPPIPLTISGIPLTHLSVERNQCDVPNIVGTFLASGSTTGFYDLDGDGQGEFVASDATTNSSTWNVYQLKSPVAQVDSQPGVASVPAAGRLTRINSGYGASTTISYRSAKEERNPAHTVPFPEIVVESVGTKDASNAALLSTTRYAYRGAQMIFDSVFDRFQFAGYRRTVTVRNETESPTAEGIATITDTYGLDPFVPGSDSLARFRRILKVGLPSDVTTLQVSGANANNPWEMLNTAIDSDLRRIRGTHLDWDVRLLSDASPYARNQPCIDMMFPYDFATSQSHALSPSDDVCTRRGFAFQKSVFSWSGTPGTLPASTSAQTVQTKTLVTAVDDFERVTTVTHYNDLHRGTDDLCSETVYAVPTGSAARILNAPASVTTTNCGETSTTRKTLAKTIFEYDTSSAGIKLPSGQIASGFLTAQQVSRLDPVSGSPVDPARPEIRSFDAAYDSASGNPVRVTTTRDDGAISSTTTSYDSFGLIPVSSQTTGTNANGSAIPTLAQSLAINGVTLDVLSVTDANGTKVGSTYDGFGRVLRRTITSPGSAEGVLSTTKYLGFVAGEQGGRRIEHTVFTDPVAPASVGAAAGRGSVTYLDSLGRPTQSDIKLGADYNQQTIIVGKRLYDLLGQLRFVADPYPSSQSFTSAYGTTYYPSMNGFATVVIRGNGQQPLLPLESNESTERAVWTNETTFSNHQTVIRSQDAAARLVGSPQHGTAAESVMSAIGQPLTSRTIAAGLIQERMDYDYDALGHLVQMTRYRNPATATDALVTNWRYDSLGRVLELREPDTATQYRVYDSWGGLTTTQWCDPSISACAAPATFNRSSHSRYDALGRLVHSEDRTNNTVIPETVHDFLYDRGVNHPAPAVTARNVLGRLAKATAPTSSVSFSYDALGQVETKLYLDRTLTPNTAFLQKSQFHGDGSIQALHLFLPDKAYTDEKVEYSYDSAGRMRAAKFSDGPLNFDLFSATGVDDLDVLGRIRHARYGLNTYTASFAETGRRLLNSAKVLSPAPLPTSREFVFAGTNGTVPAFDPMGRERSRREIWNGNTKSPTINSQYDALGRLQQATRKLGTSNVADMTFAYDALGNLLQQVNHANTGPATTTLNYQSADRDRVCSIAFNRATPSPTCTVKYDGVGNIIEMPTRGGVTRHLSYMPSGAIRSIAMGNSTATFDYDAFGGAQRLVLNTSEPDARHDKHFGGLIGQRDETVNNVRTAILTRSFPGPSGMFATKHGPGASDPWTLVFGEGRGNRFVTDHTGAFVQDLDYQPYGETVPQPTGERPGSQKYLSAQWNGGDALAALGVSQLGARLYDPVIGRFLSRDPLLIPRTATTTNPYAFAMNDPINLSDPSGLETIRTVYECLSCRTWSESGSGGGLSIGGRTGIVERAIGAVINALQSVFAGWTAGGGPMVARGGAATVSISQSAYSAPGANPTSARGGGGDGGFHIIANDGSVGPIVAGPPYVPAPQSYRTSDSPEAIEAYDQLIHDIIWADHTNYDPVVGALDTVAGKPGKAADVVKYSTRHATKLGEKVLGKVSSIFGFVTDRWEEGRAVVKYIRNPSRENFLHIGSTFGENALMTHPGGWAVLSAIWLADEEARMRDAQQLFDHLRDNHPAFERFTHEVEQSFWNTVYEAAGVPHYP